MAGVLQSGGITPGHMARWTTDGVIQDGGGWPVGQRVLASLRGANFNTTGDQPIVVPNNITAFQLTGIVVTNAGLNLTVAAGGFYPQAAKGGTPIVAAAQVYSALSSATALLQATITSFGQNTRFSAANLGSVAGLLAIWLSLTTPQGLTATADAYLIGVDLT